MTVRLRPAVQATAPPTQGPPIQGPPTHDVVLPRVSTDPLDELVDRIRPTVARAVDALQVAAALEADGCTDRIARVEYGFSDVFMLAAEVFQRLGPPAEAIAEPEEDGGTWRGSLRLIAHGPLYMLPAAVFPAVLGVLGHRSVVLALVVAGGVGWMAAGTVAYAAYQLLGAGRPGAAARLLRLAALLAPALGAAVGTAVMVVAGGGWGLAVLAAGQLTYQLAATVLMFYRREGIQALIMAPAVLAGGAFLVTGPALRPIGLLTAVAGLLGCYAVALRATRGHGADGEPATRPSREGLAGVTAYGLCSAALLLHAEAPYLLTRLDVAVAVAPLMLAMGFVEWRAERFRGAAIRLTRNSFTPADFGRRMWALVGRETVGCLAATALLGLALLAVLAGAGELSGPAALMTAAHVVLGGAYYSAFLLAGFERFGRLCLSIAAALAVHVGVGAGLGAAPLFGRSAAPLTDTALYLGSTVLLLGLFLLGLAPILGQVRHYR
ncbi:hypothetical protein BJ973_004496 [Actinoplanes tereljensis]|uniref:Uncharacterized protein n=1 Tax=Paractinoplanes tereljensis TaxID=571912 RepID=A0A919TW03_9ACTN|nr:hypothetical protein [Actinoplanes tereljensis]GIF23884.1 hypothetical protein Ate02nite_66140 [Actinoplanes tereljensis]